MPAVCHTGAVASKYSDEPCPWKVHSLVERTGPLTNTLAYDHAYIKADTAYRKHPSVQWDGK